MRRSALSATLWPALLAAAMALSACTSTQEVLEPAALVSTDNDGPPASQGEQPAPQQQAAAPAAQPQQTQQQAAIRTDARVQFPPVIGAPGDASAPLAARLAARAGARGIGVAPAGDGTATLVMRGYFSAFSEGGETTVIYVWDVVDPAGTRVHRIQGQERSRGGSDGWASVQPATMETIAEKTVDELANWLGSGRG